MSLLLWARAVADPGSGNGGSGIFFSLFSGRRRRQTEGADVVILRPDKGKNSRTGFKKYKEKLVEKISGMWDPLFYIDFITKCE